MEHLGYQPPASHLTHDDEHADADQVGGEQKPDEDECGQKPAKIKAMAIDPRGSNEEEHTGPQALDPATGQIDLRYPVFEHKDGVDPD